MTTMRELNEHRIEINRLAREITAPQWHMSEREGLACFNFRGVRYTFEASALYGDGRDADAAMEALLTGRTSPALDLTAALPAGVTSTLPAAALRVYSCRSFAGHCPVGTAAVVIAADETAARVALSRALRDRGLPGLDVDDDLMEHTTSIPGCWILADGSY